MARNVSRRELGLLLVLGAAAAVYFWYTSGEEASPGAAPGASAGKGRAKSAEQAPRIPMDLLVPNAEDYNAEGRDLFKYAVRPPTAEEIRRQRAEEARLRKEAEEEAKRRMAELAAQQAAAAAAAQEMVRHPPKPQPPPIDLKYLGYMGPKNDRVAAFEDGDQVLVAKKGEVVKNQFRVVDIRYETVVMSFTNPEFKGIHRELHMTPASNK